MATHHLVVLEMSCDHCKSAIESEVGGLAEVDSVSVDLDAKTVDVTGGAGVDAVVAAVGAAGYGVDSITSGE